MAKFLAKRVLFRNGERHFVLSSLGGLSIHEATLYLAKYRTRGRAANMIHAVCMALALLYRELDIAGIDLLHRLRKGQFLTVPGLNRLADATQHRMAALCSERQGKQSNLNVIDITLIRMRRKTAGEEAKAVIVATQATRLRYIADYLEFLAMYIGTTLSMSIRKELAFDAERTLKVLGAQVPSVSKRSKLGTRERDFRRRTKIDFLNWFTQTYLTTRGVWSSFVSVTG